MFQDFFFNRHLDDDEVIHRVVHKHWFIGTFALFWPTVSAVAAATFFVLSVRQGVQLALAFWVIISLVWWLRNFFDYYLDAWIITDHGIIDIAWHGWFHRESARVLYSDLQGVSYEIHGVLGTLFNFGEISVEKISTGSSISMDHVKSPRMIETLILKNMETYVHKKNMKDAKQVQEMLSTLVAEQIVLRDLKK